MFLKILDYFRLNNFEIFEPTGVDRDTLKINLKIKIKEL
jgi:hypothetical protein